MASIDLSNEIAQALSEFSNDVEEDLEHEKEAVANEAVAKLKRAGSFTDNSGRYRKGWRVKKVGTKFIVHNATRYQLTHLLENGHAKRNGGRTRAFTHIAPVDEWVAQEFPKRLQSRIGR
ncbi:HK97 gp10 family phage protein [Weissella kandleri]|uniref:HK97 gp10 family phage protein n=1 Tax=Weissella kandleri TaxID=1616 RepID=UPI00387E6E4F